MNGWSVERFSILLNLVRVCIRFVRGLLGQNIIASPLDIVSNKNKMLKEKKTKWMPKRQRTAKGRQEKKL